MTNAERFMQRYMEVWPSFDADRLELAIDPGATIHHSGMARPIQGVEEPDYVRAIKSLMPDISLEVAKWAAKDDVVFIEYEMSGTLAGRPLDWTGIGRARSSPGRSPPTGFSSTSTTRRGASTAASCRSAKWR